MEILRYFLKTGEKVLASNAINHWRTYKYFSRVSKITWSKIFDQQILVLNAVKKLVLHFTLLLESPIKPFAFMASFSHYVLAFIWLDNIFLLYFNCDNMREVLVVVSFRRFSFFLFFQWSFGTNLAGGQDVASVLIDYRVPRVFIC